MTEYELKLVYKEGVMAYKDDVCFLDNPYDGVSEELKNQWDDGWWDMFYVEE